VSETDEITKKRVRSPNHPVVDLKTAIERAAVLHGDYKKHAVLIGRAQQRWKYKPGSSVADQTVAALRAYGLLRVTGTGKQRKVAITDAADRIIGNAPDRDKLIREAALAPPIHGELWEKYGQDELPHDDVIREYLRWEREGKGFNEDVVGGVVARFKSTIAFAKLDSSDIIEEEAEHENETSKDEHAKPGKKKPAKSKGITGPIGMVRDLDIPLQNGGVATFPVPMTSADHTLLAAILEGLKGVHIKELSVPDTEVNLENALPEE